METTIQKWGNSQGIRLAQHVLKGANVHVGDTVLVSVKEDVIIIQKQRRKRATLEELVARIPKGYKPAEYDWGKPAGKEVW
ncbi:MAG: AbrB/MazE/SpoVT family DNA-binding domain-containing protein [Candidatus Doudnabacteria bacterium]|nr:AbrB/MazE/SpoVT family DNA-binding domain-containing protein [Candidatus Doudnabacteria bacterium]